MHHFPTFDSTEDIIYSTPLPRSRTPLALIQLEDPAETLRLAKVAATKERKDRLAFLNKRAWARRVAQWAKETAPPAEVEEGPAAEPYVFYTSRPTSTPPHTPTRPRIYSTSFSTPPRSPAYTPPRSPAFDFAQPVFLPPLSFSPSPSSDESGSDRSASPPSPARSLPTIVLPTPRRPERRLRLVPSLTFISEVFEEESTQRETYDKCAL